MLHYSSGSRGWSAPRALRTLCKSACLLLAAAWTASSGGCLLVIGEEPASDGGSDGGSNADSELGAPDADLVDGSSDAAFGEDAAPREDAAAADTGAADAAQDASTALDAQAEAAVDGAADTGLDAETGVGPDSGDQPGDTGVPEAGADSGCGLAALTWYPDDDEDGYGRSSEARTACSKPAGKWSLVGGDCRDSDDRVHPNQTMFFQEAYSLGNGLDSYDYNCANGEEGNPAQATLDGGCGILLNLLLCGNSSGYAENAERAGAPNPLCGSKILVKCQVQGISCVAGSPQAAAPYTCR